MQAMRTLTAVLVVAAVLYAACAQAAPPPKEDLPATLERVTGSRGLSYSLFAVMAFLTVLLIYRGIRSR